MEKTYHFPTVKGIWTSLPTTGVGSTSIGITREPSFGVPISRLFGQLQTPIELFYGLLSHHKSPGDSGWNSCTSTETPRVVLPGTLRWGIPDVIGTRVHLLLSSVNNSWINTRSVIIIVNYGCRWEWTLWLSQFTEGFQWTRSLTIVTQVRSVGWRLGQESLGLSTTEGFDKYV